MQGESAVRGQARPLLQDDDVIWVHDYHLMLLGRELRARGHYNPIGFFLHTPCAPPDILRALPGHGRFSAGSLIMISSASRPRTIATTSPNI